MKEGKHSLIPLVLAGFLSMACVATITPVAAWAQPETNTTSAASNSLRAEIMNKALKKSQFKNVQVSVHDSIARLTGTVSVYAYKAEAERRVSGVKGVEGVENHIQIAGPRISDAELQQKVLNAVQYSRVGWNSQPFNAVSVSVRDGVVTLGGHAVGPVSADTAVATAENIKGVQDVVNEIQVDPVSPMDNRIRFAVYRAVYGFPTLNKYAINPLQPIRISVQNGHVTLYGVVDSQADKDTAGIRAKTVPGTFSVTNDLQVAGQENERK